MVPEDTVKNLIDSCTKLIQKIQTISDESHSDSNNQNKFSDMQLLDIMPLATGWALTARTSTLAWFKETYVKGVQMMNFEDDLKWLFEPSIQIISKEKQWINDTDPNKGGNPKNGMQMGLLNDKDLTIEEKKSRLKSLIQTYDLDNQKGLVKYVLSRLDNEDEIFSYLFESRERKYVFQIVNIKHISDRIIERDTDRQKQLYKNLNTLLSEERLEKKLKNLTEILILMTLFLTSKENLSDEQSVNDYISKCMKKFDYKISDNSNAIRNAGIISRIKRLKWGPEDFVRDPNVIKKAQDILSNRGILTLGGLGAVGKTALANKLTLEAAKNYQYDYYVIRSTKVGSKQGDLDPDSENMISDTDSTNNIASTMLRSDGSISGSIERICEDILLAQNGDFDIKGYDPNELIKEAIIAMKKDSYLITIDNYEDIEDPDFEGLEKSEIQQILRQQEYFKTFFQSWSMEYESRLNKNSRIIITTRGKGKDTENDFFRVPALSLSENKELFRRKLESRTNENIIDNGVYVYAVQEIRDQVESEFKKWTMPVESHGDSDFPSNEYKFQPAYTIFSACGIRTKQDKNSGVLEQIKYWDPKGEGAKNIRKYVTEKVFGGIPDDQIKIFAKLLAKGKIFVFDYNKIIELSKDLDEAWRFTQAVKFVDEFEKHRDFFVQHINGDYGWNQFYFLEIIDHFRTKYNELLNEELQKERDKIFDGKDKREYTPIVYQHERNNIMTWLTSGTLTNNIEGTNTTFSSCIMKLLKEKDLNEHDIAQALMMIIGNKSLQIPEKIFNSLFPGKPPKNNLFELFRQSTKRIKGTGSGEKNTLMDTQETTFVKTNFRFIWDYFINIIGQFANRMMINHQHYQILKLYNVIRQDAEECVHMSDNSIIDKWDLLNFYKQIIDNLNQFKQDCIPTEIQDFESISHRILMRYINLLKVLPKSDEGISFDLSCNQLKDKQKPSEVQKITDYTSMKLSQLREHAKTKDINRYSSMNKDELLFELTYDRTDLRAHYKVIIDFVNNYVDFNGTHDDLLGNVFWLSLRYIAIQDGSSSLEITERRDLQNKLKSYIGLGAKIARLNFTLLESKVDKVMRSFEQITWNLDEIIDESIFRYGGLKGKLVRYNPIKNYQNLNREIIILDLEYLESSDFEPMEGIYKIRSIDGSNIYLIPQVNESGNTINEHEQLSSIDEIRNIIYKYFEQNAKTFKSPMKWSEFKSKIPHKELFSELDDVERFDEKEYRYFTDVILSEKRKKLLDIDSFTTESSILYVKFGEFSGREQEKIQIYKWETIDVSEECKKAITKDSRTNGLALPKNPKDFDMFIDELMSMIDSSSKNTWNDLMRKIKTENKHLTQKPVYRFVKVVQKLVLDSVDNSDEIKIVYSDKSQLRDTIIEQYRKTATFLYNNKGEAYQQINEVFDEYFWKLRWIN